MFRVENVSYDVLRQVSYRSMGYGQNDLGDRVKPYLWVQRLDLLFKVIQHEMDEFIDQCVVDDKNQPEPDIDYLYQLNYPSAQNLIFEYPSYFCQLIFDYQDLIYRPFFDVLTTLFSSDLQFVINTLTKVSLKNGYIHMEGEGFFVGESRNLKNYHFSYELNRHHLIGSFPYFKLELPLKHFQCLESNHQHLPSRYRNVPTSLFLSELVLCDASQLSCITSLN